jgi:hypothetical protein
MLEVVETDGAFPNTSYQISVSPSWNFDIKDALPQSSDLYRA